MGSNHRIIPPGDGQQHLFRSGELFTWKTLGTTNGGVMDFGELLLEPGVNVPAHVHHGQTRLSTS